MFSLFHHTRRTSISFFDVGLASVLKRVIKSHLQRLTQIIRHTDFPNETVKVRWLLVNALIDAWYQILTSDLYRPASETCGLFPFSLDRVLQSSSIIDAQVAVRFLGPQVPRDFLNINAQIITEPIKIKEISRSLHSDHSNSLMEFDATLDYQTVVHRIVYRDDLGTTFHTDPPPLLMLSNGDHALNCPIGVHTFTRNSSILPGSSLEECTDLFLRCGARSGGILEKHVTMIAQLRETPRSIVLKGLLVSQSVPLLVENTRASSTHPIVRTSFANDLEMSGHYSCLNIIMVPTLMMSTATGELHLVCLWYPEFTLARVLARENFRFPLGCVECYGRQMTSALKTMRQVKVVHTNISVDT
jgi:hypothetical protein